MKILNRFNDWLAVKITSIVGTMWCAYVFAGLALISLPDAIKQGTPALIAWIAQTFLQLVLLSIIIVGQNIAGAKTEGLITETHNVVLDEFKLIKDHFMKEDADVPPGS